MDRFWAIMTAQDAPGLALFGFGLLVHMFLKRLGPKSAPDPNPKFLDKTAAQDHPDPDIFPHKELPPPTLSPSESRGLASVNERKATPQIRKAKDVADGEDVTNRVGESFPPPPSLGELGAAKLLGLARMGLSLALLSQATNLVLHKVVGVQRGTFRGGALKVLQPMRSLLLLPGAGTMAVVAAITLATYLRASAIRRKRRNAGDGTVAGLLQLALESLGKDLHEWAQGSEHLRTFSENDIGWLIKTAPAELRQRTPDVTDEFHNRMNALSEETNRTTRGAVQQFLWTVGLARRPKLNRAQLVNALGVPPCRGGWDGFRILLVPGLLTKWYPLYFKSLRFGLARLGFEVHVSRLNTDACISENAKVLRDEILCIAAGGSLDDVQDGLDAFYESDETPYAFSQARTRRRRKVVLYGHSKGATDATACFSIYPETMEHTAALVSAQGPHGGSWLANDICCTKYQKAAVSMGIEQLLAGSRDAIFDLAYEKRRKYYEAWPEPVWTIVPTICLAACATHHPGALLSPVVEYMRYRYGDEVGATDGCVAMRDAALPGSPVVWLMDMDHFGPAWNAFPAVDRYDKTHLALALISMTLEHGAAKKGQDLETIFDESEAQHRDTSEDDGGAVRDFLHGLRQDSEGEMEAAMATPRQRSFRRKRKKRTGPSAATEAANAKSRQELARWLSGPEDSESEIGEPSRRILNVPAYMKEKGSMSIDAVKRARSEPSFG